MSAFLPHSDSTLLLAALLVAALLLACWSALRLRRARREDHPIYRFTTPTARDRRAVSHGSQRPATLPGGRRITQ